MPTSGETRRLAPDAFSGGHPPGWGRDRDAWITAVTDSGIEELARFARGLQDDLIAIQAGLTLEWSNGTAAGRMTRLKLLKRHGYGHAGL
jgi:transposase